MALVNVGTFVVTEQGLDRHSQRVVAKGLNVSDFKRNPVMFYNHDRGSRSSNSVRFPIGLWKNLRIDGNRWLADAYVDDEDEIGAKVISKVKSGIIKAASVGMQILGISDDAKDKLKGQKGVTITKAALLEISLVDVPANPRAIKLKAAQKALSTNHAITPKELLYEHSTEIQKGIDGQDYTIENKDQMKGILSILKGLGFNINEEEVTDASSLEKALDGANWQTVKEDLAKSISGEISKTLTAHIKFTNELKAETNAAIEALAKQYKQDVDAMKSAIGDLEQANKSLLDEKKALEQKVLDGKKDTGNGTANSMSDDDVMKGAIDEHGYFAIPIQENMFAQVVS